MTIKQRVNEIQNNIKKTEINCRTLADLYGSDSEMIEKKDENINVYLNSLLDEQ